MPFDMVHRRIRRPQQRLHIFPMLGKQRYANTHPGLQQHLGRQPQGLRQRLLQTLAHGLGLRPISGSGHDDGEFVTTQARRQVTRAQLRLHALAQRHQQRIPGGVAMAVIDPGPRRRAPAGPQRPGLCLGHRRRDE